MIDAHHLSPFSILLFISTLLDPQAAYPSHREPDAVTTFVSASAPSLCNALLTNGSHSPHLVNIDQRLESRHHSL